MVMTCHEAATHEVSFGINSNWTLKRGWSSAGLGVKGIYLNEVGGDIVPSCSKDIVMEDLCHRVKLLQEEAYSAYSIRDNKKIFSLMRRIWTTWCFLRGHQSRAQEIQALAGVCRGSLPDTGNWRAHEERGWYLQTVNFLMIHSEHSDQTELWGQLPLFHSRRTRR